MRRAQSVHSPSTVAMRFSDAATNRPASPTTARCAAAPDPTGGPAVDEGTSTIERSSTATGRRPEGRPPSSGAMRFGGTSSGLIVPSERVGRRSARPRGSTTTMWPDTLSVITTLNAAFGHSSSPRTVLGLGPGAASGADVVGGAASSSAGLPPRPLTTIAATRATTDDQQPRRSSSVDPFAAASPSGVLTSSSSTSREERRSRPGASEHARKLEGCGDLELVVGA